MSDSTTRRHWGTTLMLRTYATPLTSVPQKTD